MTVKKDKDNVKKKKKPVKIFTMKFIITWIILFILLIIQSYKLYKLMWSFECNNEDIGYC